MNRKPPDPKASQPLRTISGISCLPPLVYGVVVNKVGKAQSSWKSSRANTSKKSHAALISDRLKTRGEAANSADVGIPTKKNKREYPAKGARIQT